MSPRFAALLILPALLAAGSLPCLGQTIQPTKPKKKTPVPPTKVAIENTNSTFTPSSTTEIPQAEPARPTVSAPAHIPPVGYLQFEQGFNEANESPGQVDRQFALSQVTKVSLTTRLLVQFLTQPYTYNVTGNGPNTLQSVYNAPGDLQFGVQGILKKEVGVVPTIALGYIRRVRAGTSANLDTGDYSQSALALFSGDLGKFHYDANAILNEENSGPVRRAQFAQSLAVSHSIFEQAANGRLAGTAELSHFTQPFVTVDSNGNPVTRANTADLLFAVDYSIRPNLVLDWSFGHGLTSTSTQWQGGFGFTYLLPHRLWPNHHPVPIPVGPYHYRNPR